MRRTKLYMLIVIFGFSIPSVYAQEIVLTFQEGFDGYTGTKDTHLDEILPTTSFGSDAWVVVDGSFPPIGYGNHGLLWFSDLFGSGAKQIPLGSEIIKATLDLNIIDTGLVTTSLHRMLQPWQEIDTWNDWVDVISADNTEAVGSADLVITGNLGLGHHTFDVTDSLEAWSAGAQNYGWAFLPGTDFEDGREFSSSDEANISFRPSLEITYVPEPATLLLFGLGALALRRKHKA